MKEVPQERLGELRTELVDAKYELIDVMSVATLLHFMNENDSEVPKELQKLPMLLKHKAFFAQLSGPKDLK